MAQAGAIQLARFRDQGIFSNSAMSNQHLKQYCKVDDAGQKLLEMAFNNLGLSARGHNRILKVSRTIADLEGSDHIQVKHLAEAIQYRALDKPLWQ